MLEMKKILLAAFITGATIAAILLYMEKKIEDGPILDRQFYFPVGTLLADALAGSSAPLKPV